MKLPLDDLKPLPGNPRTNHRIGALVESLRTFGFGQPATVNERTGHVLAGNGRVTACRRMRKRGDQPPHGVTADWEIPAYVVDLSEADERKLAVALNGGVNGSLEGKDDREAIAAILRQIDDTERAALGLREDQVDQLLLDASITPAEPQVDLDLDGIERAKPPDAPTLCAVTFRVPESLRNTVNQLAPDHSAETILRKGVDALAAKPNPFA